MRHIIPMPHIVRVKTEKGEYPCDCAIVCTGGLSYPTTGSTGDGYKMATQAGHTVTDLKCGLCGVNLRGDAFKALQGLALKNVSVSLKDGKKEIYRGFGEMLFTHFGISGPLILSASSYYCKNTKTD